MRDQAHARTRPTAHPWLWRTFVDSVGNLRCLLLVARSRRATSIINEDCPRPSPCCLSTATARQQFFSFFSSRGQVQPTGYIRHERGSQPQTCPAEVLLPGTPPPPLPLPLVAVSAAVPVLSLLGTCVFLLWAERGTDGPCEACPEINRQTKTFGAHAYSTITTASASARYRRALEQTQRRVLYVCAPAGCKQNNRQKRTRYAQTLRCTCCVLVPPPLPVRARSAASASRRRARSAVALAT